MPPTAKVTKADIIEASLNIIRHKGVSELNARAVAKELKCSTQPIYSIYASMEELKTEVTKTVNDYFDAYLYEHIKKSHASSPYGASGLAYIQFAKEEKELYRLLFMQNNIYAQTWEDEHRPYIKMVMNATGLDMESAKNFHLQMWLFIHGISTFFATSYLDISDELIHEFLNRISGGLLSTYEESKNE